mgnify:CR=1 FL=1|jgi:hypothetical protein
MSEPGATRNNPGTDTFGVSLATSTCVTLPQPTCSLMRAGNQLFPFMLVVVTLGHFPSLTTVLFFSFTWRVCKTVHGRRDPRRETRPEDAHSPPSQKARRNACRVAAPNLRRGARSIWLEPSRTISASSYLRRVVPVRDAERNTGDYW